MLVLAQAGMITHEISHYSQHIPTTIQGDVQSRVLASTPCTACAQVPARAVQSNAVLALTINLLPITVSQSTKPPANSTSDSTVDFPSDQSPAGDQRHLGEVCLQCLSFAQMGGFIVVFLFILFAVPTQSKPQFDYSVPKSAEIPLTRYHARAPPLFI